MGSIPGLGRSPWEGKGYPLQYSGLDNSMDCIVHGVTKSLTQLSDFHFSMWCLLRAIPCPALHFRRTPEVCLSKWEGDVNSARGWAVPPSGVCGEGSVPSLECHLFRRQPPPGTSRRESPPEGPASSQPDPIWGYKQAAPASIPPPGRARTPQPLDVCRRLAGSPERKSSVG